MDRDWEAFQAAKRYIFRYEDDLQTIEITEKADSLHDVMLAVRGFLLAAGFHPDGVSEYIEAP